MEKTPSILYQDKTILVVQKPAGMPSQPDHTGQQSVLTFLQENYGYVGLIHRLDTPTGGVMLFALSEQAVGLLSTMMSDKDSTHKEYLALLPAPPEQPSGVWEDYLYHDKRQNKSFVVQSDKNGQVRKGAKYAKLSYEVIHTLPDGTTLVKVKLYTGRTHQIRVQFAHRGLPLLGDGKYGSRYKLKPPGFALWAYRLSIQHPVTHESMMWTSLPPMDIMPWHLFQDVMNQI